MKRWLLISGVIIAGLLVARSAIHVDESLWKTYNDALKHARYVDLTHAITPSIPLWPGFAPPPSTRH
jgi:hypothetical protein